MKRIEIIFMKPKDLTNKSVDPDFIGKHLVPKNSDQIFNALEDCLRNGFDTLFIYARMPSKAVSEWIKDASKNLDIEYIPGSLSGRGGYLVYFSEYSDKEPL